MTGSLLARRHGIETNSVTFVESPDRFPRSAPTIQFSSHKLGANKAGRNGDRACGDCAPIGTNSTTRCLQRVEYAKRAGWCKADGERRTVFPWTGTAASDRALPCTVGPTRCTCQLLINPRTRRIRNRRSKLFQCEGPRQSGAHLRRSTRAESARVKEDCRIWCDPKYWSPRCRQMAPRARDKRDIDNSEGGDAGNRAHDARIWAPDPGRHHETINA